MSETFSKREREKRKRRRRLEKQARREERREEQPDSWKDMIAYVDEFGVLQDTPPEPTEQEEIKASDIVLGVPSQGEIDNTLRGFINFYDVSKGYGFIKTSNGDNFFMHDSNVSGEPERGKKVSFEKQRSYKGWEAVKVVIAN